MTNPLPPLPTMTYSPPAGVRLSGTELVRTARLIAVVAHAGQADQSGASYIHHPYRVASKMVTPLGKAVAWLHDVLEDTLVTKVHLVAAGIPENVIDAVEALTHAHRESRVDYLARVIEAGSLAVDVKLADIEDNLDPRRREGIDPEVLDRLDKKYLPAQRLLRAVPFVIGVS